MMHDPTLADLLFILLVGGLIWVIMALIGRLRRRASHLDSDRNDLS